MRVCSRRNKQLYDFNTTKYYHILDVFQFRCYYPSNKRKKSFSKKKGGIQNIQKPALRYMYVCLGPNHDYRLI